MYATCILTLYSCNSDIEEDGKCHSYYILINKSDYDIRLKYHEKNVYIGDISYDTTIRMDSSYTIEEIWDIKAQPFHFADTIQVSFLPDLTFEDYAHPFFNTVKFASYSNYIPLEENEYIRKASYTITNADYEYAKQKLEERDRHE